jgi:hypothetical protein
MKTRKLQAQMKLVKYAQAPLLIRTLGLITCTGEQVTYHTNEE